MTTDAAAVHAGYRRAKPVEQISEPGVTVYRKIATGLSEHALLWAKTQVFYSLLFQRVILLVKYIM